MMINIEFYDGYFPLRDFSDSEKAEAYKEEFIMSKLHDRRIYKFVAFTDNQALNRKNSACLTASSFGLAVMIISVTQGRCCAQFNMRQVCSATGRTVQDISFFFRMVNEMNDISCFTYMPTPFMWEEYANHSNGFCMEFELLDTDKFFPVIYLDKNKIDYTKPIIESFNSQSPNWSNIALLSMLPWVTKAPEFEQEHEIRFLCGDVYDSEDGPMGGRIFPGKKEAIGYKGYEFSFDYSGIQLKKIIIRHNSVHTQDLIDICNRIQCPYLLDK